MYDIIRIVPFQLGRCLRWALGAMLIKRSSFWVNSRPSLSLRFWREIFLAYKKIASRDGLLPSYKFYGDMMKKAGVIQDSYEDVKVG